MQIIFTVLIDALSTVGKNGQQILAAILKQIKANSKLLTEFATSGRVESALINHIQVRSCSTDLYVSARPDSLCYCLCLLVLDSARKSHAAVCVTGFFCILKSVWRLMWYVVDYRSIAMKTASC